MANTNPLSTPCTAPGCTAIGAEPCYSCLIDGVVMIHAERLAAIVEAAERERYRQDCAAICEFCDDGDPVTANPWRHSMSDPCAAAFIHDAWAKSQPKDNNRGTNEQTNR